MQMNEPELHLDWWVCALGQIELIWMASNASKNIQLFIWNKVFFTNQILLHIQVQPKEKCM